MNNMLTSESKKRPKKTLDDLLKEKTVITGKEVIKRIEEKEEDKKVFEASAEFELRNRRKRK